MQVTLFTKQNCQLCDAIKYELMDLQSEYGFMLREEYVEGDQVAQDDGAALFRQWILKEPTGYIRF